MRKRSDFLPSCLIAQGNRFSSRLLMAKKIKRKGDGMAFEKSGTSCILRMVRLKQAGRHDPIRMMRAANDNTLPAPVMDEPGSAVDNFSVSDLWSVIALLSILGVAYYFLMYSASDFLRSLRFFHP